MSSYTLPTPLASSKTIVVTATINHAWKAKKTDFSIAKNSNKCKMTLRGQNVKFILLLLRKLQMKLFFSFRFSDQSIVHLIFIKVFDDGIVFFKFQRYSQKGIEKK